MVIAQTEFPVIPVVPGNFHVCLIPTTPGMSVVGPKFSDHPIASFKTTDEAEEWMRSNPGIFNRGKVRVQRLP